MKFRLLFFSLCLSAPLLAQDPAKPSPPPGPQDKPSTGPDWSWPLPSADTLIRFAHLSAAAKARLQAEFASSSDALRSLSVKEYNARFEKAFRAAVQDDEAKGLSSGGMPAEIFKEHGLALESSLRSSAATPARDQRRGGPTPEMRERFEKLSDAAKDKIRSFFRDNRDRMSGMADEERRSFIESNLKPVMEQDEAGRKGK